MEFHQRNNSLHTGRRSTGREAFLVGILVLLNATLPPSHSRRLLTDCLLCVCTFSYLKIATVRISYVRPLPSCERCFSIRGDVFPLGDIGQYLETLDGHDWEDAPGSEWAAGREAAACSRHTERPTTGLSTQMSALNLRSSAL